MKKLIILFLLMLTISAGAAAKSMVITLANNTKVYYQLGGETNPMMRFVDGKITVDADDYEISDIKNFYISIEDAPNAIESTMTASSMVYSANTLVVKAAEAKTVKVYSVGGKEVNADVQRAGEVITVNLNGLDKGAYIISTGDASFKVFKK